MKQRIKIDVTLMITLIILTVIFLIFPRLYSHNNLFDDFFDCIGISVIFIGVLMRMSARGHKRKFSKSSEKLVMSGPYTITRNPMYLGSFLLGVGFILIVWPWWMIPFFTAAFYIRFNKQMVMEEKFLTNKFGEQYIEYSSKVARIFPLFNALRQINLKEVFNFEEAFSTKEKRGLVLWPILAVILESIQERIVFGYTDIMRTIFIFVVVAFLFFTVFNNNFKKQKVYE